MNSRGFTTFDGKAAETKGNSASYVIPTGSDVSKMKFANISFVGHSYEKMASVAQKLAKRGTESDISIFDKREGDVAMSIAIPNTYPERMQPLLQSLNLSDASVLFADSVDGTLGELIVSLSTFGVPGVVVADSGISDKVFSLVKTRLSSWSTMEYDDECEKKLREYILGLDVKREPESEFWRVDVDHSFEVKGVGTVALGIVTRGTVRVHDRIFGRPGSVEGAVRSIQIFDVDHHEAEAGSRVGLALKGMTSSQVPRGTVLTNNMRFQAAKSVSISFKRESFYRDALESGKVIHLNAGLQCIQSRIIDAGERLDLEFDQDVAFEEERAVVFNARPPGQLRIAGHGMMSRLLA